MFHFEINRAQKIPVAVTSYKGVLGDNVVWKDDTDWSVGYIDPAPRAMRIVIIPTHRAAASSSAILTRTP